MHQDFLKNQNNKLLLKNKEDQNITQKQTLSSLEDPGANASAIEGYLLLAGFDYCYYAN